MVNTTPQTSQKHSEATLILDQNGLADQIATVHLNNQECKIGVDTSRDSIPDPAKTTYLTLSTHILRLPREIRDLIYAQVFNRAPPPFFDVFWPEFGHVWLPGCPGPPCTCLRHLPHFIDANYMGRQVAREMLETCKTVATQYLIDYVVGGSQLKAYFTADAFHVGMTRAELFGDLDLVVEFGEFMYREREATHGSDTDLDSAVGMLLNLPFERPRKITFDIKHSHTQHAHMTHALRVLGPAFRGMRDKGFDVRFTYVNYDLYLDWEFGPKAWEWSASEWLTNYLDDVFTSQSVKDEWKFNNQNFETEESLWTIFMNELYGVVGDD
ncbi:hypothetical protein K505DRAFT_372641, partial [Melanomma pulvis-pyrius CBS 109.77]